MKEQLESIRDRALQELGHTGDLQELEKIRVNYLGKKGELTAILKQMGGLSPEERPVIGQLANQVREQIEEGIQSRADALKQQALARQLAAETIDVTLPGKPCRRGAKHPLSIVLDEIQEIFIGMGFEIVQGPRGGARLL